MYSSLLNLLPQAGRLWELGKWAIVNQNLNLGLLKDLVSVSINYTEKHTVAFQYMLCYF